MPKCNLEIRNQYTGSHEQVARIIHKGGPFSPCVQVGNLMLNREGLEELVDLNPSGANPVL